MNETYAANVQADILTITPPGKGEVIRIAPDGKLFWHGREVETDMDFRSAMLELAAALVEHRQPRPQWQCANCYAIGRDLSAAAERDSPEEKP